MGTEGLGFLFAGYGLGLMQDKENLILAIFVLLLGLWFLYISGIFNIRKQKKQASQEQEKK